MEILAAGLEQLIGAVPAAYAAEVTRRVRDLVGPGLVGVWLFGSAALGDFDPRRSDIDIQAVSAGRLPRAGRARLAAALGHDALPCPARGLEFVLYAREDLSAPLGPAYQLNLNSGGLMQQHVSFDPGEDPRFWFTLDLSIGREAGRALHGPAAASVLPRLALRLVRDAARDSLEWHVRHGSAAEAILGACRVWAFATDGRWRSKTEAARWARPRLSDPDPVERALRLRAGAPEPPIAPRDTGPVLAAARAALDSAPALPPR
jgi:Domain of unknown function (DUF4111)/Nucleotidyltransferase domain